MATNKQRNIFSFMLINLVIAGVLGIIIVLGTLFWLNKYTRNGDEIEVPNLTGANIDEAAILAHAQDMNLVVIDSIYDTGRPFGTIIDQTPKPCTMAKRDRTIYVVINEGKLRQVAVPDVIDKSVREATKKLRDKRFVVDEEIKYMPAEFDNLVLDIEYKGEPIAPGTVLKEGSTLMLVVGMRFGEDNVRVPDLLGLTLAQARAILLEKHLIIGAEMYDSEKTDENADKFVIFHQSIPAGSEIMEGSRIDLKFTTDIIKAASSSTAEDEEDFW